MNALRWLVVGLLAGLIGYFTLQYMVAPPLQTSLFLALGLVSLFILIVFAAKFFHDWQYLWISLLGLASFALSYQIANYAYFSQTETRTLPPITRAVTGAGGGTTSDLAPESDGHTAIVYFTHGEPQAYSPMPWIETFHELDADGVSFIPKPFRAFFLSNVRKEYLEIGGSLHNKVHQSMLRSLEKSMPEASQASTRFYLSFLDSPPRPDEAVIQAINEGADKIILAAVFLTDSSHTQAGHEMVEALDLAKYGVQVCMTEPLWTSEPLKSMFVTRANQNLGNTSQSKVGILLVGHGQPSDWDKIYGTQTEQENIFREEVKQRLVQEGYKPENVLMAWMEFKQPKIEEAVRQLVQNGVEKIFVFPASISADSIHSDIQIPNEAKKANVPTEIQVVNLGAWGDDPLVIQAIREKIMACQ
jgi:protoheme ferro-lyase